jgi:hypothetical protein
VEHPGLELLQEDRQVLLVKVAKEVFGKLHQEVEAEVDFMEVEVEEMTAAVQVLMVAGAAEEDLLWSQLEVHVLLQVTQRMDM